MNTNNTCNFVGRFVKDPELQTKGKGQNLTNYCMFTLAVDRVLTKEQREAKKNGDDVVTADFPQFVCFGETAKAICDWFSKGKPIQICAEFQSYKKDDGNGGIQYGSNFIVRSWGFVPKDSSDSGNTNSGGNRNNSSSSKNGRNNNSSPDYEVPDDDIPF